MHEDTLLKGFKDRQDIGLAFMLQFENIAWYNEGKVFILDRRVYPIEVKKIACNTHQEVAVAIKDMVTQSEGPYIVACHGIVLAVYEATQRGNVDIISYVNKAAYTLTHARPTTTAQMERVIAGCLQTLKAGVLAGLTHEQLIKKTRQAAFEFANENYRKYKIIGKNMASLLNDGDTLLTHCFAGTVVGTLLLACREMNKNITVVCTETRPYWQGARLTASVVHDMGFDVTVISDNMVATAMQQLGINVFFSASDVITMNGDVINKVGTLQIALLCKHFNIPYYCTGTPDHEHKNIDSVTIEFRNPELVLMSMDKKLTMDGVKGYYPAFDITPAQYVTGIVTDKKIYKPETVKEYLNGEDL